MPQTAHAPHPGAMTRETIALPATAPGTHRVIDVRRFGVRGARPKVYLQAGLHADELPGILVLARLAERLERLAAEGAIRGEIVVVPVANPIGLSQHVQNTLIGRYDMASGQNYNRNHGDIAGRVGDRVAGRLGPDAGENVALIRAAMGNVLSEMIPVGAMDSLRHALLTLAHDADCVLDLHADSQAVVHLYMGTRLWPGGADLAGELGAKAVLLAEVSGGHPFDEAASGPWWALAARFPDHPVPPACFSATVELRSNNDVDADLAEADMEAILRVLMRRGAVAGDPGDLPPPPCEATPLDAMQQLIAPSTGLVVYCARLGQRVEAGDLVAEIVDPSGGQVEVRAATAGVLFARHDQPIAWPGKIIGKIAGAAPLADRVGTTLLPA